MIYTQTVHKFNFILQVVDFLSFSLQQPITEWYNLFHSSPKGRATLTRGSSNVESIVISTQVQELFNNRILVEMLNISHTLI